jgi:hypothetical protein
LKQFLRFFHFQALYVVGNRLPRFLLEQNA